jgi:hypothetical protein
MVRLDYILEFLFSREMALGLFWVTFVAFVVSSVILIFTRWGESQAIYKCMAISLVAHFALAMLITVFPIVGRMKTFAERVYQITLDDGSPDSTSSIGGPLPGKGSGGNAPGVTADPWEEFVHDSVSQPDAAVAARAQRTAAPEPNRESLTVPRGLPIPPPLTAVVAPDGRPPEPQPSGMAGAATPTTAVGEAVSIAAPPAVRRDAPQLATLVAVAPGGRATPGAGEVAPVRNADAGVPEQLLAFGSLPRMTDAVVMSEPGDAMPGQDDLENPGLPRAANLAAADRAGGDDAYGAAGGAGGLRTSRRPTTDGSPYPGPGRGGSGVSGVATGGEGGSGGAASLLGPPRLPSGRPDGVTRPAPEIYKLRTAPDRLGAAQRHGASPETEAAVRAALKWLADNQKSDGRWSARETGAGQELLVNGRNRQGAGIDADTGITGLALLSMLAAGHTHRDGTYKENVRKGLEYLLKNQASDGNLAGSASGFARMYCHAIASFAMSEAYGMTGDRRLEQPVRRAIGYTVASQHPTTGGWRYVPGDPGDTSQHGWQLMALKSAELAGIPMPEKTKQGAMRYLQSVKSGQYGGLASYRPSEPATRTMTAEALVCWQFLGMKRDHKAGDEAGNYILGELPPGKGKPNLYYWYYATLGMYQLQGTHWEQWNTSLTTTLLASQKKTGPLAGSWDNDTVWGGYGGRVYSTAMATLCLEVYYRFLPLYADAAGGK